MTRIVIDPNVRVRGQLTYAGFEDVEGSIAVGQNVDVVEPESGLVGKGLIVEIDLQTQLVYLGVDWSALVIREEEQTPIEVRTGELGIGRPPAQVTFSISLAVAPREAQILTLDARRPPVAYPRIERDSLVLAAAG